MEVYINKDRIIILSCKKRTIEEIVMECEDEGIDTYLFFAALSMATLLVEIVKQEE